MNTKKYCLAPNATLMQALKQMDGIDCKLLIVTKDQKFIGLISMGDIQRHFVKNQNLEISINRAMRDNVKIAYTTDDRESIKEVMLKHRMEYMPIVSHDGHLDSIITWEELFEYSQPRSTNSLNLPVVIMAGGIGSRLRPLTYIIPKPLIPIGERPVIQVIMDNFIEYGCSEFFCSVNYKADMIKGYFKGSSYNVQYFEEDKPLGTAGSLRLVKDHIKTAFFVSNCDIIINDNYEEIYNFHKKGGFDMTSVAFVKEVEIPYGVMEVGENSTLISLKEKPKFTYLVNAGLYLLEPHLLSEVPEDDEVFHITHLMEKVQNRGGSVGVFPISNGSWLDIGQWEEYQKTLKKYGSGISF